MKKFDEEQFFKYTRMTNPVFSKLLNKIKPSITKQRRNDEIPAEEMLVITLQYLSQGMSMQVLAWNFHIGLTTVHKIIHETCIALWKILQPQYLKTPSTEEKWLKISDGFESRWNFPHCLGSLDSKHITIEAPAHSGSLYFTYKKRFSIVLLATCDSKYRFTMVDIGAYGSHSDGGIFRESIFGQKLDENDLNVPKANFLKDTNIKMPYFLVADEAFPLKQYIMRPYGGKGLSQRQRVFNYSLSRARQVIENTFGIMASRWRILKTNIIAKVENIDNIVKAVTVLHNYCQTQIGKGREDENIYCPSGFADSGDEKNGKWRDDTNPLKSVGRMSANYSKRMLYELRDSLANYFWSAVGAVPWQMESINKGLHFQD